MNRRSSLVKKTSTLESHYRHFFGFLKVDPALCPNALSSIRNLIAGYYSKGFVKLSALESAANKCWFVNTGMVIGLNADKRTCLIFEAGTLAILPDSFFNRTAPICYLVACPETHLLEITAQDVEELFKQFPLAAQLSNHLMASYTTKFREKGELKELPAIEAVAEFYRRYPDLDGPKPKVFLKKSFEASYLNITSSTFSRLRKVHMAGKSSKVQT